MNQASAHQPGWYDDGSGRPRWWDGAAWGPYAQVAAPTMPPTTPSGSRPGWWLALLCALIIGAGAAIGAVIGLTGPGSDDSTDPGSEASGRSPEEVFLAWDESFREEDCQAFRATTTERFRAAYGGDQDYTDCAGFAEGLEQIIDGKPRDFWETYEVEVIDVEADRARATVEVEETWEYYVDTTRREIDTWSQTYTYELVLIDGEWFIDDASFLDSEDELES